MTTPEERNEFELQIKTLVGLNDSSKKGKLEFKKNVRKEWYWTLTAFNGRQIASCIPEYYKNKMDCAQNAVTILMTKWTWNDDDI